jgi:hypothetical protein
MLLAVNSFLKRSCQRKNFVLQLFTTPRPVISCSAGRNYWRTTCTTGGEPSGVIGQRTQQATSSAAQTGNICRTVPPADSPTFDLGGNISIKNVLN